MNTLLGGNTNIPNEIAARSQSSSDSTSERIKRPPNSFILYRSYKSQLLKLRRPPKMPQADLSKVISEMWQNEPPEVREEFDRRAKEAKAHHSAMYPDYRYRPQRKTKKSKERGGTRKSGNHVSASTNHAGHETVCAINPRTCAISSF